MKTKKIFISFIEENSDIAGQVWDKLNEEGFTPWAYTKNGSAKWKKQVVRELQECDIMILIFSKKTDEKADKQIVKELGLASEYEKEIIPFMIDEISPNDIKTEEIAYEVVGGNITWIGKEEPLEKQIETLISRIKNYYNEDYTPTIKVENKLEKNQKSFNWKYLIIPFIIATIFLLGYVGYTQLNNTMDKFGTFKDPTGLKNIVCGKKDKDLHWSGWKDTELVLNNEDKFLYVNVHYYAYDATLKNIRLGLKPIPYSIRKNETIKVDSFMIADNSQPTLGSINIKSLDNIELILEKISFQENECQSINCETKLVNYSSQKEIFTDLFEKGVEVGDKSKGHYGNLVIKFRIRHKEINTSKQESLNSPNTSFVNSEKTKIINLTTNEDPNKIPTLQVTNKGKSSLRWTTNVQIDSSELLSFQIHYYGWHKGINDLRVHIKDLRNKVFYKDDNITVNATVSSKNLKASKGIVNLHFDEKVRLKFKYISWRKNTCMSNDCETPLLEDYNKIFTEKGLSFGDTFGNDDNDYFGNIVVVYEVEKVTDKNIKQQNITTNQSPNNIPTLKVSNKRKSTKRWDKSVHIDSSEILSFQLHYYTGYLGAVNLHAFIDNLRGKVFDENQSIKVHGKITSDNLSPALGEAEVIFDEAVRLQLHRISWQKSSCNSTECEVPIKDNINNLFNERGLSLGDVPKEGNYYSGNLIVEFKVVKLVN